MNFFECIAAFFYLQPSLILTFVPVQITALFVLLLIYKKDSVFNAFLRAFVATVFAIIIIFLIGLIFVPFANVSFLQMLGFSFGASLLLVIMSAMVYWFFISCYLQGLLKMKKISTLVGLSSAIAAVSVIVLYYLLWHS